MLSFSRLTSKIRLHISDLKQAMAVMGHPALAVSLDYSGSWVVLHLRDYQIQAIADAGIWIEE